MKLLSKAEALLTILVAMEQIEDEPTYRMGQALYNLIVDKVGTFEEITNIPDHYSWYNSQDKQYCVRYFLKYFVEKAPCDLPQD